MTETTRHPFEISGLGKAPFRFLFCYSLPSNSLAEFNPSAYNAALKEMPRDVGCGSCQHCGMAIMHNMIVESSDGKRSAVGSECVAKTHQKGEVRDAVADALRKIRAAQLVARRTAAHQVWLDKVCVTGETNRAREVRESAERYAERDAARSARFAAQQAKVDARAAQAAADVNNSTYLGKIGERRDFTLTYSHAAAFPGHYGTFYIQTFRDENGAMVVYKGGTPLSLQVNSDERDPFRKETRKLEAGDVIKVKATVKDHSTYNEVKQTIISRAKVTVK